MKRNDIQDWTDQIHAVLTRHYTHTNQFEQPGEQNNSDLYNKLFKLAQLDDKHPTILPKTEFIQYPTTAMWSGMRNKKKNIKQFQSGTFRVHDGEENAYFHGLGYYFTPFYNRAKHFAPLRLPNNVMVAKPSTDANYADYYEIFTMLRHDFPDKIYGMTISPNNSQNAKKLILRSLLENDFVLMTLMAHMYGFQGIEHHPSENPYAQEISVTDRSSLVMPQQPTANHFKELRAK
jgi:hypothetical protein